MAEEEKDPEREVRVTAIMELLLRALDGQSYADAQCALGNAVARIALLGKDPDGFVMMSVETTLEVYRAARKLVREGNVPTNVVMN